MFIVYVYILYLFIFIFLYSLYLFRFPLYYMRVYLYIHHLKLLMSSTSNWVRAEESEVLSFHTTDGPENVDLQTSLFWKLNEIDVFVGRLCFATPTQMRTSFFLNGWKDKCLEFSLTILFLVQRDKESTESNQVVVELVVCGY